MGPLVAAKRTWLQLTSIAVRRRSTIQLAVSRVLPRAKRARILPTALHALHAGALTAAVAGSRRGARDRALREAETTIVTG